MDSDKSDYLISLKLVSFLFIGMRPSVSNPIARAGLVGNLGSAVVYFAKILVPGRCHTRMPFYIENDSSFGDCIQSFLFCRSLALNQYISSAYKIWWLKVTISDLRSNASVLQKSTETSSSRQDKDAEAGSSKKVKGKK